MYYATFWIDVLALVVGLVIFLGNVMFFHKLDKKSRVFLHSLAFLMIATFLDAVWNFVNGQFNNLYLAKAMVAVSMISGLLAFLFLGMYIFFVMAERGVNIKWWNRGLQFLGAVAVGHLVVNSTNGRYIYYYYGHVYHGPQYNSFIELILIIAIYVMALVLAYSKKIGLKDTIISISFYVLPAFSLIYRAQGKTVNIVYGSGMVSLLIINNLLHNREMRDLELREDVAVQSEKNKTRFLANMSHEIRTPINAVLGLNEMILRESKEDNIIGYANDIKSAGGTLLSLVNDVLDFSKIESGKMELVEADYEISSILNDVVNLTVNKAKDKGLDFELEADSSIPRLLHGDEVRIKQIITNLLNNAVKYTKAGRVKLKLAYEKTDDFAINMTVSVEDTGMGIKQEDIDKLFQPFSRLDEKENRNVEGTGLGMSITKHFLSLMNSKLDVKSTYGVGSTFEFTVRQEVVNWEPMGNYEEAFKRLRGKKSAYKAKLEAPDAKVLIVDDMPMNLTVVKGLLKGTKVNVETATSGPEMLELCSYNKYDIIYLDHMMPGMDGVEALKKLKEDKEGQNYKTPAIALTANAVSGAREEYIEAGFDDYLTKPINPERLEKSLITYLPEKLVKLCDEPLESQEENNPEVEKGSNEILEKIKEIPLIDFDAGMQAAGGEETYLVAAKEFALTVDNTAGLIEKYWKEGDMRNYTIQVHGLKSTSRIVGDNQLSELARTLEFAGKDENRAFIDEKTQELLDRFIELKGCLDQVFEEKSSDKEPIDEAMLKEAIDMIKQGLEAFDFDTIGSTVEQLEKYQLPESFEDTFKKMRVCVADVDYDGMVALMAALKD